MLDYGCGDGTFLAMLLQEEMSPDRAVGVELHQSIVDDCQRRFSRHDALRFALVDDLGRPEYLASFDTIYCMEVFEHVVDPGAVLDRLRGLLVPGGALIISVPIETGLPVIVKQVVRRVAGWRGIGHYPGTTSYTPIELLRSVCAGSRQHISRPVFAHEDGTTFHDHKGFNWRVLRGLVAQRFELVEESTSPVAWVGPQLGTQRWFVARKGRDA